MNKFKINFDSLDWQSLLPGARAKVYRDGAKQTRLVEFTSAFVEPQWCEEGHIGVVLSGSRRPSRRVIISPNGVGLR